MARILVTGASGLLGGNLAMDAAATHDVTGVFNANMVVFAGVRTLKADLSFPQDMRGILQRTQPEWVIHCAAATNIDLAERDPDWAYRLNLEMPREMARTAGEMGARFLHISTDAIFDGDGSPFTEVSPARPTSVYGKSKLAGEQAVREVNPTATIVRTNLFGWSPVRADSLAEWFLGRLVRGESCPGFRDVSFSPILVNDLAEVLLKMLSAGLSGVYHVGGATCLSKYEFGRRLADLFGLRPALVRPASVDDAGMAAPRQKYLCLDSHKIERELGVRLPTIDEGLARFKALAWRSSFASLVRAH